MRESFVYRLVPEPAVPDIVQPHGTKAIFIDGFTSLATQRRPLKSLLGNAGLLKLLLKAMSRRRFLCGIVSDGRVVSHVWATAIGRHYPIEENACVLGPLRTEPEMQRKGFATAALQNMVANLQSRGYRTFYIDTSMTNIASQRTIARAGFGPPFALLQNGELVQINRI